MFVEELRHASDDSRRIDAGRKKRESGQKCPGEQMESQIYSQLAWQCHLMSFLKDNKAPCNVNSVIQPMCHLLPQLPGSGSLCLPSENHRTFAWHISPKHSKHTHPQF